MDRAMGKGQALIRKMPEIVTRQIAGETLLVPIRARMGDLECIYTLNETGTRIWSLLESCPSVEGIVSELVREYQVSPGQARKEVEAFLESLKNEGLISMHQE